MGFPIKMTETPPIPKYQCLYNKIGGETMMNPKNQPLDLKFLVVCLEITKTTCKNQTQPPPCLEGPWWFFGNKSWTSTYSTWSIILSGVGWIGHMLPGNVDRTMTKQQRNSRPEMLHCSAKTYDILVPKHIETHIALVKKIYHVIKHL